MLETMHLNSLTGNQIESSPRRIRLPATSLVSTSSLSLQTKRGHLPSFQNCVATYAAYTITHTMADEIFDIVNDHDEVIGQAPRREVHARGLWHRAVHVLVFNARGEVFLQKRSMLKDTAKGKWDSSSSGHVDSGEDYDACAVRELREEISLTVAQAPRRLFKIDARKETGWEFCWVYRCESEGPFILHPDEIETGAWFSPDTVTKWVAEKPDDFASAFVFLWQRLTSDRFGENRGERVAQGN